MKMNVLEVLLNKRWIIKSKEKDLYHKVKDELGQVKKFLTEKLGYQVIVNPYLIKVEKMPAKAMPWMGIREFNHKLQYIFLCIILMFLEDKESEEQFVLSELTEYIQSQYREESIDWTSYTCRRHLIRVIKYCVSCGMLETDDGSEEDFAKSDTNEVLYENTGVSRYFMKNFTHDIMEYTSLKDFGEDEWIDINMDRGIVRRQRVYRKLLMGIGMYREGEADEDFAYVRNYRNMIGGELEELLDCELQVHRNSAFLIIGENGSLGRCFPEERTLSDIVLLCNHLILENIHSGKFSVSAGDALILSGQEYRSIIEECKKRYGMGMIKTYREMATGEFYEEVKEYMEEMDLIEERGNQISIRSAVAKVAGQYPEDFVKKLQDSPEQKEREYVE